MDEKVKPVVQRRRKFNEDERLSIREKSQKLLDLAGNSNVEESLRSTLCPVYATAFSTGSPSEPSLGSPNVTCKTHRRRL